MLMSDEELEAKQIELNSQADPTRKIRKVIGGIPLLGGGAGSTDVCVNEAAEDDQRSTNT